MAGALLLRALADVAPMRPQDLKLPAVSPAPDDPVVLNPAFGLNVLAEGGAIGPARGTLKGCRIWCEILSPADGEGNPMTSDGSPGFPMLQGGCAGAARAPDLTLEQAMTLWKARTTTSRGERHVPTQ